MILDVNMRSLKLKLGTLIHYNVLNEMSYQLRCDNKKSVSIITLCMLVFDPDLPFKVETCKFFNCYFAALY